MLMIRYCSINTATTIIAAQNGDNQIHCTTCCDAQLSVILVRDYKVTIINVNILYYK